MLTDSGIDHIAITMTAGATWTRKGHRVSVSKNLLLETLAGGFETGALTIAHDLPLMGEGQPQPTGHAGPAGGDPHRTVRSKGCLSNKTALAMVFKLAQAAQNSWRRLDGHNLLPKLIVGVKFIDGIEAVRQKPQAAA